MCANFFVQGQEFDIPSMNNLKGQVRKLKDALARTQKAHREEKRLLSEQVQLMEKKVTTECKLLAEGFCLPFLQRHILGLGTGQYPKENVPIFLQMAQCGEGIWSLFVDHLGFPTWRTVQNWRRNLLNEMQLSREVLDGQPENVKRVLTQFFGEGYESKGTRVVLAVDAAGVTPNVVVHKDGVVDGFVDPDATITPEQAASVRSSLQNLRNFISENRAAIIRDFFVVLVCPLESESGGFPILVHPKGNGSADQGFVSRFLQLANVIAASGVEVVGLSFDGDTGYLQLAKEITGKIYVPNLHCPLSAQNVNNRLIFEDLLHLVKCIRYRFVSGSKICPFPFTGQTVTVEHFRQVGIVEWVLDSSQARKMDDFLPLMMFNPEHVLRAVELNMPEVACVLLPATLLITAVMEQNLSRQQRLDYLSTAWAFFWCYLVSYTEVAQEKRGQTVSRQKGQNPHMQIYDVNTLDKGLSLCYSLSKVISDGRPVHLGSLGTHWLEHFFGRIRRLCARNDCAGNFERSLFIIMLQKLICPDVKLEISRKRLSDSGAILQEERGTTGTSFPLGTFMHEAMTMLQIDPTKFPIPFIQYFANIGTFPMRFRPGIHPIVSLIGGQWRQAPPLACGSVRACRMVGTEGLTTRCKDIMKGQI